MSGLLTAKAEVLQARKRTCKHFKWSQASPRVHSHTWRSISFDFVGDEGRAESPPNPPVLSSPRAFCRTGSIWDFSCSSSSTVRSVVGKKATHDALHVFHRQNWASSVSVVCLMQQQRLGLSQKFRLLHDLNLSIISPSTALD